MDLNERLAGAVWGHLVGDAMGVPYEFKDAAEITSVEFGARGTHSQPPGTWSDDGALMLALLDSLLRDRDAGPVFDTADQAKRFLGWSDRGAYTPDGDGRFDIGNATRSALGRVRDGADPETTGGTGEWDNDNGSLMRILPIALVDRDIDDAALVDRAHRSSAVTHGHTIARATCALYVLVARSLLAGNDCSTALQQARGTLRALYATPRYGDPCIAALDDIEAWPDRSGRGYVIDSFWSAWDALAKASTYQEVIERAVRYGQDTDTTAAIAGGLAGITFGSSGIPADWLAGMRGKTIVEPLIERLTTQSVS